PAPAASRPGAASAGGYVRWAAEPGFSRPRRCGYVRRPSGDARAAARWPNQPGAADRRPGGGRNDARLAGAAPRLRWRASGRAGGAPWTAARANRPRCAAVAGLAVGDGVWPDGQARGRRAALQLLARGTMSRAPRRHVTKALPAWPTFPSGFPVK